MNTTVTLDRSGLTMAVALFGHSDQAPAIVIHGMAERGEEVAPIAHLLAERYRVIVPDLPGHGDTAGRIDALGITQLAASVAELAESMGIADALVVGHSLGATVATALAGEHPELVNRLVLLDPGMGFPDEMKTGLSSMYDSLTPQNFADTLNELLPPILFGPDDSPELVERVMGGMIGIGRDAFVALGHGLVAFDGFAAIARVTAPTLLIVNDHPLPDVARLEASASDLTVAEIAGVSHQSIVSDPRVHAAILGFIASAQAAAQ